MKIVALILSSIVGLHALCSIGTYVFDFNQLAVYGKGYLLGKTILLIIATGFIILLLKRIFSSLEESLDDTISD